MSNVEEHAILIPSKTDILVWSPEETSLRILSVEFDCSRMDTGKLGNLAFRRL